MLARSALVLATCSILGCAAAAPSASPSPSSSPVRATASNGSVRVTLTLERPPRNDGLSWATVTIENVAGRDVVWAGGGCGDPGGTDIDLSRTFDYGRADWPGQLGAFKQQAIGAPAPDPNGSLTAGYTPEARIGTDIACTADLRIETLASGATLAYRAGWDGRFAGQPVPSGPATVLATFPFIGFAGQVPPGAWPASIPVVAKVDTEVVGSGDRGGLAPGHAIDLAMADPALAAWIRRWPENTWINPDLDRLDGIWHVGLFVSDLGTDRYGGVQIDGSGRIVARQVPR